MASLVAIYLSYDVFSRSSITLSNDALVASISVPHMIFLILRLVDFLYFFKAISAVWLSGSENPFPTAPLKLEGPSIGKTMYGPVPAPHFFKVSPNEVSRAVRPTTFATSHVPKNPKTRLNTNLKTVLTACSPSPCSTKFMTLTGANKVLTTFPMAD